MKRTFSDFIDTLDDVREDGTSGYVASCPAHQDSRPSLRVAYNEQTRNLLLTCRAGCAKPDVLRALDLSPADLFDVSPGDTSAINTTTTETPAVAVREIAALRMYVEACADAATDEARTYAARRFGIDAAAFTRLRLGTDDTTVPAGGLILSRGRYQDTPRLTVPLARFDGTYHYVQGRALTGSPPAKWSGPNNPPGSAWGKHGFFPGDTGWADVVITEGPGDALTSVAVGYDTLAVRGAGLASNTALMDELAAHLKGRRVVIAGDNDSAGRAFTSAIARALSERGCDPHRLVLPEGAGDVTAWREQVGAAAFPRAFASAVVGATPYGKDQITSESIMQQAARFSNDVYNAQALLAQVRSSGHDLRYTSALGFMVYDPRKGVWSPDDTDWVRRQAHAVAPNIHRSILDEMGKLDTAIAGIEDKELRIATGAALDKARKQARNPRTITYQMSQRGLDSMIRELRALDGVAGTIEDFDQHPHLLPVRNGVINLETGELRPHSEETHDLLLMRNVDVDYRPDARNPRWEQFIEEVFEGHEGLPAFMQRFIGYGITGYTSEQCFGICFGTGANGKSVFLDTLARVFAGVTMTTAFDTFESRASGAIRSDIARLKAARLVLTAEGEQGRQMDEALLKRVTGQDLITARFLYKEEFEYRATFLILMASNYRPSFRGQDEGIWRRIKLIPFTRYFAPGQRDQYLTQKFVGERVPVNAHRDDEDFGDGPEGILAWAVRGAQQWFAGGLNPPPVIAGSTEEYRGASDALGPFYEEHLVRDPEGKIGLKELWAAYREWAEEEGLSGRDQWKRSTLMTAVEERGAIKRKSGGVFYFRGIRAVRPSDKRHDDHPADKTPFD